MSEDVCSVVITDDTTTITVGGDSFAVPCGTKTIGGRHIVSDPPQPEELTNAIGEMVDHVDDVKRELPGVLDVATFVLSGAVPRAMATVEVGSQVVVDEFLLSRDAAEDVFRTLATESSSDRAHNPGLPADLVADIVGGCCVVIGLIRGLQLDGVTIKMNPVAR